VDLDESDQLLAGAYGTESMTASQLVSCKPYWPAILNVWDGAVWQHTTFDDAGMVSSVARDADGRIWAATSRGGAARESVNPESWVVEPGIGGLYVHQDGAWHRVESDLHGLPSTDVSVVRVADDGSIWIGTEGWGLARYEPNAEAPTPTATLNLPTRTPTPTVDPSAPTATRRPTIVPTQPPPLPSPTRSGTAAPIRNYLPFTHRS